MTHVPAAGPARRKLIAAVAARLAINGAVPVVVYLLVRPHVHSDLTALIIGAAIPAAYTIGFFVWRRRLDPTGVIAVVCFCAGLLLVLATGGNELVFKIREDLWTGPVGLACLVSVALRRPLFLFVLQLMARRNAQIAERIRRPQARRITTVSTAVIGLILLVHAVALIILAMTVSTATYLAASKPISWAIVGGGLVVLVWWIRRQYPGPPSRPGSLSGAAGSPRDTERAEAPERERSL
jgi:hypothetical protein